MRFRAIALVCLVSGVVALSSCSSSNNITYNPVPVLGCGISHSIACALVPTNVTVGSQTFTLLINGSGFISKAAGNQANSVVTWNGSPLSTYYNFNNSQIQAVVPAALVATIGQAQINVVNPPPGGGVAISAASFYINAPSNNGPVISSLSPSSAKTGASGFTLTVTGTNFASGYVVTFNGAYLETTFGSSTQLTAAVPATSLTTAVCAGVAVVNPSPTSVGIVSPTVSFAVGSSNSCDTSNPADARAAYPQVVSVSSSGGAADGSSSAPSLSAGGRFVAFYSKARNLVAAGASGNIFVRDTCLGAPGASCTPRTFAIDLSPDGAAPNAEAGDQAAISADGRFVSFVSYATNLAGANSADPAAAPTSPIANVFVRDLCTGVNAPAGCVPHTDLISISSGFGRANNSSISPSLSADGRFVAFVSWADNLVSGTPTAQTRVFVRDTCAGPTASQSCVPQTYLVPADSQSRLASAEFDHPAISLTGRYVAFQAWVAGARSANAQSRLVLADTCLGLTAPPACLPSSARISFAPDGAELSGISESPSVSADARFVAFQYQSSSAGNSPQEIFLRDTCLGATAPDGCVPSTALISADSGANLASPWLSPSGRFLTFVASAGASQISSDDPTQPAATREGFLFLRDTCFGVAAACTPSTISVTPPSGGSALAVDKFTPVPLTADGRLAAFFSASSAPASPASGQGDVFLTVASPNSR
ncbi:MAG: IPT/TIG domain-containing protein [Candidatus Acidiferrales bacterium]